MNISLLFILSAFLLLSIISILYSVKSAQIQDEPLEGTFDPQSFAKPKNWKIGKMPPELQQQKKTVFKKSPQERSASVVNNLMERLESKKNSPLGKEDVQE